MSAGSAVAAGLIFCGATEPLPESLSSHAKEKAILVAHAQVAVDTLVHGDIATNVMRTTGCRRQLHDAVVEEDSVVVAHHAGMVDRDQEIQIDAVDPSEGALRSC